MFDKNFYPTPDDVISRMIRGEELAGKTILESSAGKGNICDYIITANSLYRKPEIYVIEKNYELMSILKEKKYKFLGTDFLTFNPDISFDYIIMNPPFDNGVQHLLKAIEISKGAKIICLLNSESINNAYTKERQLLLKQIEDNNGEIIKLGQCFRTSERATDVDVVCIKLQIKEDSSRFKFKPLKDRDCFRIDEISNNQLARVDVITNIVDRYNLVVKSFEKFILTINEMIYFAEGLCTPDKVFNLIRSEHDSDNQRYYNKLVNEFKRLCWSEIFSQTNIQKYITTKIRNNFYSFQEENSHMAFSVENIEMLFDQLFQSREMIFSQCIEEAFDTMTKYHKENRVHIEGWVTNDAWRVNRKVILPYYLSKWEVEEKNMYLSYQIKQLLEDIEKALCFIAGKEFQTIKSITNEYQNYTWGELGNSEYFEFRIYKKGTIHLKFKDDYIYEQFNIIACKGKNWLKK